MNNSGLFVFITNCNQMKYSCRYTAQYKCISNVAVCVITRIGYVFNESLVLLLELYTVSFSYLKKRKETSGSDHEIYYIIKKDEKRRLLCKLLLDILVMS